MSWISERELQYRYEMEDGSIRHVKMKAGDEQPKTYTFEDGQVGKYVGFEPDVVKQTHNVEYDQNGRKAVRVRGKNGEIQHISKTKMHYMKTGRIENQYTDAFQKKMQQEAEVAQRKEKAMEASQAERRKHADQIIKEQIKNMPDGEYVSDGINFTPMPKQK